MVDGLAHLFPENNYFLFSPKAKESELNTVTSTSKLWRSHGIVKESYFKKLDVYHGLSNELPLASSTVKKVVTIHDVIFKREPQLYGFTDRVIYNLKTKKACESANKIITVSEFSKRDLIHYYNVPESKIEVIYQDCHPQFYQSSAVRADLQEHYGLPDSYVLCVGTIEKRKSQLTLVKAMESIDENLVLLGRKTKYWDEIQAYLDARPALKKRVLVLDNANFKDFPAIYRGAKVFVYPSTLEGFGIPVIEALNSDVPVITTAKTVMEEACGDAGLLFESLNSTDLKEKIEELLHNKELRNSLIKKGQKQVLRFRKEQND